uniref:AmmeMemoRadiSam system protein B n=1 Tax=Candidatus Desulfatibia profunda TaxID=2841695 RepID=A0A8J6NRT0_9BACT|nr:AmmeMemoRadiSam system protein B [Candidatus Desulfatibia profunda]
MKIREATFAGSWYPDSAAGCKQEIKGFLKQAKVPSGSGKTFTGGIVPHAGWYFSGSIACNVFHCLKEEKAPDVIAVFGMHLHPGSPSYLMTAGAWETPFGPIEIEKTLAGELAKQFPFKIETAEKFTRDNTIELQLPFIKYFFEDAKLVPIGVPPTKTSLEIGKAVADIATRLGQRVKVIGSTDLTHYGYNYGFVVKGTGPAAVEWVRNENDRRVIDAMLAMDPDSVIREALENQNACCGGAAATAIAAAKQLGARQAESIAYATSYDKSPGDSFVGYVGIVF